MVEKVSKPKPDEVVASVELTYPIIHGGRVTELQFRRVRMGDLRAIRNTDNEIEMQEILISRLSGIPFEAVETIDAADIEAIQAALDPLIPDAEQKKS